MFKHEGGRELTEVEPTRTESEKGGERTCEERVSKTAQRTTSKMNRLRKNPRGTMEQRRVSSWCGQNRFQERRADQIVFAGRNSPLRNVLQSIQRNGKITKRLWQSSYAYEKI